jgi:hypothetical protein
VSSGILGQFFEICIDVHGNVLLVFTHLLLFLFKITIRIQLFLLLHRGHFSQILSYPMLGTAKVVF